MVDIGFLSGIGSAISGSFGGITGAIGGVASTILGNNSAKHEAERNRQFQEDMSNTSISRRMQDLRNSGLNPLLAVENASSGASTPSGSQAQIQHFSPELISVLSTAKLQKQQGEVAKAEERKINAEAQAQENDNTFYELKKRQLEEESELRRQGILTEKTVQEMNKANTLEAKARIMVHEAQAKGIEMSSEEAKRKIELLDIELKYYRDNPDAKSAEKYGDLFNNPSRAVGSFLGSSYSAYQHWKEEKEKKSKEDWKNAPYPKERK